MILPDVNVLIYAFRKDVPQHGVCRAWLAAVVLSDSQFGVSPRVLSAVVRITTNARAFRLWSPATGTGAFSDACASRRTREDRALPMPGSRLLRSSGAASGSHSIVTMRGSRD